MLWETGVDYSPVLRLDENRVTAMKKMAQIQQISETLCDLDCGSCGAPTCRAFAEDVVRGTACKSDCVLTMRETLRQYLQDKEGAHDGT